MARRDIDDLRTRLADNALAICRHYLFNGQRCGNYWVVGDVHNAPGRSLFLRLRPDGTGGKAGRWTDAATGEFGDLFDIIGLGLGLTAFSDILDEAERFLGMAPALRPQRFRLERSPRPYRTRQARRLFQSTVQIQSTLGETYLLNRGIDPTVAQALRFAPSCFCRPTSESHVTEWPAIIASVTDLDDILTGVHRIYLDGIPRHGPEFGKAPIAQPKRSLGSINRHAARFGPTNATIVVGEGIENVLSVRTAFPALTVHAALTAGNLADYQIHPNIRRLLIAGDNDEPGRRAVAALMDRARQANLHTAPLWPITSDHNADLRHFGIDRLRAHLRMQIDSAG